VKATSHRNRPGARRRGDGRACTVAQHADEQLDDSRWQAPTIGTDYSPIGSNFAIDAMTRVFDKRTEHCGSMSGVMKAGRHVDQKLRRRRSAQSHVKAQTEMRLDDHRHHARRHAHFVGAAVG
jgi:hypothetical protein